MKISPMRSLFIMWLMCSVWMLLVWWLGSHAAVATVQVRHAEAAEAWSLAEVAVWGGMVLILFLAFYLALAIKLDLGRLRIAVRDLARGTSTTASGLAPEWVGLLDDVRAATRRQQQEAAGMRQELESCQSQITMSAQSFQEEQNRAARMQAATAAEALRLRQVLADIRSDLLAVPIPESAQNGSMQAQTLLEPVLARLNKGLGTLQSGLQPLAALLDAAAAEPLVREHDREADAETQTGEMATQLIDDAARLGESLQLLCLNFRLALERLGPGLSEDYPELDTVMQDLAPLCAETAALQDAANKAQNALAQRPISPSTDTVTKPWPLPAQETRRVLTEVKHMASTEAQAMADVLQEGLASLELVGKEPKQTPNPAALVIQSVLERLDRALGATQT